jgi:methionyl aminopeptidase
MKSLSKKHQAQLEGGRLLSKLLFKTLSRVKPGVSTLDLENYFQKKLDETGLTASFKTVDKYPFCTCININEGIVHGLPQKEKIIKKGDLVSVDAGLIKKTFHSDMAYTVPIGKVSDKIKAFLKTGEEALELAIKVARPGNRIGDISKTIQTHIESAGYSVSPQLTGHSIGKKLHEDPLIPGVLLLPLKNTPRIKAGQSLAIEVIYSLGSTQLKTEPDDWTISTKDGSLTALFEKTVLVTQEKTIEATNYLKNLIK